MQNPQPFVVPAGVTFQITDAGVVIENEGDIVLHTNFGRALTRIVSTAGSITVHAPVEGGTLQAAGSLSIHGDATVAELRAGGGITVAGNAQAGQVAAGGDVSVGGNARADRVNAGGSVSVAGNAHAEHLAAGGSVAVDGDAAVGRLEAGGDARVSGAVSGSRAQAAGTLDIGGNVKVELLTALVVKLGGGTITARGVQGARAVHVGASKVQVDAIIAPEVHLDPHTSGRATVVESQNDLGPNALKGGFRLADYAEMFGDPTSFLAERGLAPLGAAPPPAPAPAPEPPVAAAAPAAVAPDAEPPAAAEASAEPVVEQVDEQEVEVDEEQEDDSPAAAAPSVEVEPDPVEAEPEPEPEPASAIPPEHPLHRQLVEAVGRIAESYADAELPPAVNHLMSLIERRAYDQVRGEITSIWSDLLKYHQKKGLRIQHQVTTTFNTINSLVKKM